MDWFRTWHGAPTDPKWILIAKKSNTQPFIVSALVWALMDYASQNEDRGSIDGFDLETYCAVSGMEEDVAARIISSLTEKEVISDKRFKSWEKRQPEREDKTAAERQRRSRENRKSNDVSHHVTHMSRTVTHGHAPDTDTDTEQNKKTKTKKVCLSDLDISHIADWLSEKRAQGKYLTIDEHGQLEYFKGYCAAKGRKYADYVAAFRNSFEWENAIKKGGLNGHRAGIPSIAERARAAANRANRELGIPEI